MLRFGMNKEIEIHRTIGARANGIDICFDLIQGLQRTTERAQSASIRRSRRHFWRRRACHRSLDNRVFNLKKVAQSRIRPFQRRNVRPMLTLRKVFLRVSRMRQRYGALPR